MAYNVYKDNDLVAEKIEEKNYTVEGLVPNTEYSLSVTQVIDEVESPKATIVVKTLMSEVAVTGVTMTPKTSTAVAGTAGSDQVTAAVTPDNATNKSVAYLIAPATPGLSVSNTGLISWTAAVPAGVYTTTVATVDGNIKDTHVLTLTDPVIAVTGVTLTPKTSTADSGKANGANLTTTIAPPNATNQAVTYTIAPVTTGLTVNASGRIEWTDAVPAGTYTATVKTTDGAKTDTHVLTLTAPPEPEPEE